MPETHDSPEFDLHLGPLRLYVHPVFVAAQRWPEAKRAYGRPPLLEKASAYEDEAPWRVGAGRAVRIPFTRLGFVVGYWDFPDPTRAESVLWTSTDDASAMLDIGVDQIVEWPGPDEVTPDHPGILVEDGVEYYVVEGQKIPLYGEEIPTADLLDAAELEFGEQGVEGLSAEQGVVQGVEVAGADEVGERLADDRDVAVSPLDD